MLIPGDPAPWFTARSSVNPTFVFDTTGGRYVVLSFLGAAGEPPGRRVLDGLQQHLDRFDVTNACFLGVCTGPADEHDQRLPRDRSGVVFFWDADLTISRLYDAAPRPGAGGPYRPHTLVLDPRLRVLGTFANDGSGDHLAGVLRLLDALPSPAALTGVAPVLVVPWVFEADVCRHLIALYEGNGGQESGFMRDVDGKTVAVSDYSHKRRRDYTLTDENLIRELQARLSRRLVPEIKKAFQFDATRIERHIVACYDAADGAHFRPHRDNTTKGTAHRRFAVTLNLNAEEYEGGNLRFPEFGPLQYRAPTGGAVVFSCSLLHEAMPVTKGKRYAFLPFLYDDAAAKVRQANLPFLAAEAGGIG